MNDLRWSFQKLFWLGNTTFDMFKANGIYEAVADSFIYHKFHVQIGFAAKITLPIKLVDGFFTPDSAKDGDSTKFVDVMIYRLHSNRTHIGDKEAGVERT